MSQEMLHVSEGGRKLTREDLVSISSVA